MLHHLSFGTCDLARSSAFYDAVLTALGYARVWADGTAVGYGYQVLATSSRSSFARAVSRCRAPDFTSPLPRRIAKPSRAFTTRRSRTAARTTAPPACVRNM